MNVQTVLRVALAWAVAAALTLSSQVAASGQAAPQLMVSSSADRSGAIELEGATLSGDVFVFLDGVSSSPVSFWVDDPQRSGTPTKKEWLLPFDLAGGSAAQANPVTIDELGAGLHSVTAQFPGGVVTATFSVGGVLSASPSKLTVSVAQGGEPVVATVEVASSAGSVAVTATDNRPWMSVTSASRGAAATLEVRVDPQGRVAGTSLYGKVTVQAPGHDPLDVKVVARITDASAPPPPPPESPHAWRDDFDVFDTDVWGKANWGCFERENAGVASGQLWLRVVPRPDREDCGGVVGARVLTKGLRDWAPGTFTARIKFVTAPGSWQTFWLTGSNGKPFPAAGEVDIAEITGNVPAIAHHRLHSSRQTAPLKKCSQGADPIVHPSGVWRTYSATTSGTRVEFRVDGKLVGSYGRNDTCTWPFGDRMNMIFSARGGGYGGDVDITKYPVEYYVDWVSWSPAT